MEGLTSDQASHQYLLITSWLVIRCVVLRVTFIRRFLIRSLVIGTRKRLGLVLLVIVWTCRRHSQWQYWLLDSNPLLSLHFRSYLKQNWNKIYNKFVCTILLILNYLKRSNNQLIIGISKLNLYFYIIPLHLHKQMKHGYFIFY